MLRLPFTCVQLTWPATFWVWPSMMTLLPPGAGALVPPAAGAPLLLLALVLGLLLEQPAKPATTVAAAAMPTKIRCFATGLLCLVADF
jgi:hypothetical protein